MNDNTTREKSYYELLLEQMRREYPIPDFQPGSRFAVMEDMARSEFARYQALEAAAREARIALTFYREWMISHGTGETRYPFGEEAEQKLAALLGAK